MSPLDFEVHQEEDEVASARVIATSMVGIIVGALAVLVAAMLVSSMGGLEPDATRPEGRRPAPSAIAGIEQTPLETVQGGIELRDRQRRELDGWGWVDRGAGIARIPIDRAIDVVVDEESR